MTLINRSLLKTYKSSKRIKEATNVRVCLISVNDDLTGSDRCSAISPSRSSKPFCVEVGWRLQSRTGLRSYPDSARILFGFLRVRTGTRFDVMADGSRRINGVRNIRQALASPHPAVRRSRFGAAFSN
jgi:hypothetical protein